MEPYIGQILAFGFNFAPRGWAYCNGQLLSIAEYQALFSLIGTTYGGDGITTFGLPDLRGRVAVNQGTSLSGKTYTLGEAAGQEQVTLTTTQIPAHTHVAALRGNSEEANAQEPSNKTFGVAASNIYNSNNPENGETLNPGTIQLAATGGNQAHNNMQPYLTINYCIALEGIYPPRS